MWVGFRNTSVDKLCSDLLTRTSRNGILCSTSSSIATEATARCLDPVIGDQLRAGVSRALASSKVPKSNLSYAQRAALKDLRNDDGIVILPADKGNATVILDKDEYSKKMKSLFDDRTTYRPVSRDPTTRIEKKIAESVRNLHRLGHISDKLKDLCDPDYQPTELRNLRETFQAYGYPTAVLDPILVRNTPTQATVTTIAAPSSQPELQCKEHTLCLPYVKGLSEKIESTC